MELRLLHGVAKGEPWFGRWGYRFGSGTYGVTQKIYETALESVRNVPLWLLNHHLSSLNRETPIILSKYQSLSTEPLITLSDLFMFMLHLHSRLPRDSFMDNSRNQIISIDSTNCRWSQKRIQMAIKVVIESLKRVEHRWISRQEVRDAARNYIGDTGLLDFVLKSLGNQVVGNYLVRRSLNPVKKVLEYCLEDISNLLPSSNHELIALQNQNPTGEITRTIGHNKITRGQVMKDIIYLYKHILMDYKGVLGPIGILNQISMASRAILDTKYFIKEYHYISDSTAKTFHLDYNKKDKRIECECGAKKEDGERMVCCDICQVWQHTRCVGIQHNEEVPRIFICQSCDQHLIPLSFLP